MAALLNLIEILRIANDGFFLKIAHNAVGCARCQQIEEEIGIIEKELHSDNQRTFNPIGLSNLDESHQMHALIFGFIE